MAENHFPAEGSVVGFRVFMDVGMGMICCTLAKAKHGRRARKVRLLLLFLLIWYSRWFW
jgi:hypothetical protein